MKYMSGLLDHPGGHCRPLFLVDRNTPYNDFHQDQDVEKSGPRQTLMNDLIGFSFSRIAFEQFRVGLFNSLNPF